MPLHKSRDQQIIRLLFTESLELGTWSRYYNSCLCACLCVCPPYHARALLMLVMPRQVALLASMQREDRLHRGVPCWGAVTCPRIAAIAPPHPALP